MQRNANTLLPCAGMMTGGWQLNMGDEMEKRDDRISARQRLFRGIAPDIAFESLPLGIPTSTGNNLQPSDRRQCSNPSAQDLTWKEPDGASPGGRRVDGW